MATYKFDDLLNTTSGMTAVKNNQQVKGTNVLAASANWFTYAGKTADVYVHSDGYVNFSYFNDATRQLQVLYTNGTVYYIYKQEGQLESGRRFLKVRVSGYITTTSTDSSYALTYELFLIEGQILFLNVVQIPKSRGSGTPTSSITDGTNTTNLNIKVGATAPIQVLVENAGVNQKVSYKKYTDSAMTFSIDSLLNTTTWMTQVSSAVTGVDWFEYAGQTVDKVYVENGSQIGFGQSAAHLKVCDRSTGKIISIYRQEGNLENGRKFLKIRVTASTYSYYTSDTSFRIIYEIFLFDDQTLFINIVQIPTQISYMGTSSITDGTNTTELDTSWNTKVPIQIVVKNAGSNQEITYESYPPKDYVSIAVTTLPSKTVYYLGDTFNKNGIVVSGITSDGQTYEITKGYTFSGFDSETVGTKTITVTLNKFTTTFNIEVREDIVTEITNVNYVKDYLVGWEINIYSINVNWESGKSERIENNNSSGIVVSGFDSTTAGEKTVTVTYEGALKEITVIVHSSATLEVVDPVTEYHLNISSFQTPWVKVTYDDGTAETSYSANFSGFDNSKSGTCEITVTYRRLTTTYTVNILDTIVAYIGRDINTDIVASLSLATGTLTLSGVGATKTISAPYRYDSGGVFENGFEYYNYIKEVVINEEITEINGVCNGMSSIEKVTLPDTLTLIGDNTFYECSSLSNVIVPENCTSIGNLAFFYCSSAIITLLNKTISIYDSSGTFGNVQKIKGHYDSTAQSYAEKYGYSFEPIDTVVKIQIIKKPDKVFHIGETLNKADFEIKATLDDGSEITTDYYTFEYDFSTTGTKIVTISLGDQTTSFTVNVIAYSFSELINITDGMEVIRNSKNDDGTDTIDGVDWFKFNNVVATKLYINGNNWIGFGTSSQQLKICNRDGAVWNIYRLETTLDNGVKLFKLRVEGYTYYSGLGEHESRIKYELFLFENGDMYLNVSQSPTSTSSYAGTSNLLSNSKTTDLLLNGATEENPVQVSFLQQDESGLDWEIAYRAYKFSTLVGIRVETLPDRTKYKVDEAFDPSGLIVAAAYDSGETETIADYTLSLPDMTSYGTKSVTVTYETFTTTFEIIVIDATGIEVTTLPDKTKYYENEVFSPAGLIVSQVYTDGSKEMISGYTLSTPDMSVGGDKTISVAYNNFTAAFEITVIGISGIEITKVPTKKEYYTGDSLDIAGMTVILKYTNGASKTLTEYTVSGFDSTNAGEKTVIVTYKTHTASFEVTVYTASGIRIASLPERIYYKIGEAIDLKGLVVMLIRNDGTEEEIQDYEINGFDSSKTGSKTITVFYNKDVSGITTYVGSDTFQIKVTNDGTNPFEEEAGDISVTVHWINGEFEDLTSENNTIQSSSLVLQESICSESYFIFGGCVSNQITFKAHHTQFDSIEEEFYPSGKIEVYLKCKDTEVKIFTGEIASAERDSNSWVRTFIAYDYLYNLQNTDIAWWYKNQTTDKNKLLTQKQFRDALFKYIGIEQVETKLHWDDTYVPNDQNSNEMKVTNILKDLCLQNDRFGHINRDGKFEYLKLRQNTYKYGESTSGKKLYKYYNNAEIHLDTFKSFWAKEGRIWFPNVIHTDPDPNRAYGFTEGGMTAQEAYENNVFYNRNSFFVGNEDWLYYVWDADEYKQISRKEPIMKICYGTFINLDLRKFYRAQGYKVEVVGNPLNTVGQPIELRTTKQLADGTELEWFVHSYIMSRTLKLGSSKLIDTYSANNAPFNGNTRQLGNNTPEISATVNRTRAEMPVISYEFSDGSSDFTTQSVENAGSGRKLVQLRCIKQIKLDDYLALPESEKMNGTIFVTYEET